MAGEMNKNFPTSPDVFPVHYDNVNEKINATDANNIQESIVATQLFLLNHSTFVDNGITYRGRWKVEDGDLKFIYEEVV